MVAIIRRNPGRALTLVEPMVDPFNVLEEAEMLLSDFWPSYSYTGYGSDVLPIDMWEEKNELVVKTELPGIKKEDIDVSLEGDTLTIKAERKQEELAEDSTSYFCERSFGRFFRSMSLPYPVNAKKIHTTFDNGVLEIRLPKTGETKAKHIEIQTGSPKSIPSGAK